MIEVDAINMDLSEEKCGKFYKNKSGTCYFFHNDMLEFTYVPPDLCEAIEKLEAKLDAADNNQREINLKLTEKSATLIKVKELLNAQRIELSKAKQQVIDLQESAKSKRLLSAEALVKLKEKFRLEDILKMREAGLV